MLFKSCPTIKLRHYKHVNISHSNCNKQLCSQCAMKEIQVHLATSVLLFKLPPQVQSNREWLQGSVCTCFIFSVSVPALLGAPKMLSTMTDHMYITSPMATAKSSVVLEIRPLILQITGLEACKWQLAPTVMNPSAPSCVCSLCVTSCYWKGDLNGNAWIAKFLQECTHWADCTEMDSKLQMENKHFN